MTICSGHGFNSSNAALLVEPDRVRLFTDFRYIEEARGIDGVEVVQTKRSLIGWLGENLSGRFGFEANVLPWSFAEQLRKGGIELVPRQGLVEQLRAVKDDGDITRAATHRAIADLATDPVNIRWQAEMAPMMARAHDFSGKSSDRLPLIFEL